jgi:hypothetical protein
MTRRTEPQSSGNPGGQPPQSGKQQPGHDLAAEQAREAQEAAKARNNEASIRDRMVDIGRGNQQSGRH